MIGQIMYGTEIALVDVAHDEIVVVGAEEGASDHGLEDKMLIVLAV